VTLGCVVFLIRRNVVRIKRFISKDLDGWPRTDANLILITEILLMTALFTMNAADQSLQALGSHHYFKAGSFPISSFLTPAFAGMQESTLIVIERFCWWFHIVGILAFLNYLVVSKHFHILLAFPTVFYSNLERKGKFSNLSSVTNEVKAMLDPSFVPPPVVDSGQPMRFGAKDVVDLNWKQLMDAYTCTECGRCTSACPANQTGKLLSPRKIMMDTRDRLTEYGKNMDQNAGVFKDDGKALLGDYITAEELWACTSCNACVQECPVNIDPLSIIVDIRRYLVMEQSAAPAGLNLMFTNVENNGAPWQFSPADRFNWATES
jgi:ferredoxin